jgi:hypothetical protein
MSPGLDSVGELLGGFSAKGKDTTTKEILAGKFKTIEEVDKAYVRHVTEAIDAEKAKRGAATVPAKR